RLALCMPRLERTLARWRHRLMRRRPVRDVALALDGAGPRYLIALPAEPDRVLDELPSCRSPAGTQTDDLRMPYWATPWASGVALARAIWQHAAALAGRRVAELGCGLGVTATAAADAGARLLAIDCFREALAYCRYNVARHTARVPCTRLVDWRLPAGRATLAAEGPFDLLLAADVLYEAEDIAPLLELVPQLLPAGGELWLAEPGDEPARCRRGAPSRLACLHPGHGRCLAGRRRRRGTGLPPPVPVRPRRPARRDSGGYSIGTRWRRQVAVDAGVPA